MAEVIDTLSEAEKSERIAQANQPDRSTEPLPNINPAPFIPQTTAPIGPDMEPAPVLGTQTVMAPPPSTPSSGVAVGGSDPGEWGPYDDYQIVNTGFGEFAVEKGKVLFFELGQMFNAKVGAFMEVRLPRYRLPSQSRESAIDDYNAYQASRPVRG